MSAALPQAASDYPLLDAFLTMLWFFVWILWIFLVVWIFMDIFRSHDLGGWAKAGWSVFVIVLPFLGVFGYLIARGTEAARRNQQQAIAADQAARDYIQAAAGSSTSVADEVSKLAALRDRGLLTDQEFATQKAKLLS
ncbi:MAG TPA: SHOCT domain-containing protein [Mycobacterium sp.]|nr:SHOCT domain-containing protein [Mycobacterium sp.]